MAQAMNNSIHWVIGGVLFVTGFLIIAALIVTYSQGDDVNANVNVNNEPPVIDVANAQFWQDPGDDGTNSVVTGFAATPGPTIAHTLGGNTNVVLKVNVSDANGWANDPVNLSARLMRTSSNGTSLSWVFEHNFGVLDHSGQPNNGAKACTAIANVSATERTFLCGINMKYNGLPTTPNSPRNEFSNFSNEHWRVRLKASDGIVNVELSDSIHYEFALGVGINTSSEINLGTIVVDGTVGPTSNLVIQNFGNQKIDVTTAATESTDSAAWICTGLGNPLVSDLHVADTGIGTEYSNMAPLNFNGDTYTHTDFNLDVTAVSGSPTSSSLNWRIATNQDIGPGTCTLSSVILTAIKGF